MSIYSGFATRQQEGFYDKLIEKALEILCDRVLKIYAGGIYALSLANLFRNWGWQDVCEEDG